VRQASWRGPASASPARVSRSGRPVASVVWSSGPLGYFYRREVNAQREAAAREAAEEQQREQAAREAQQAERAREEAEQRAQAVAAKKAQQVEEQRRRAEQQAERAAFARLRTTPELSPYIDRAEPALVFLYVTTSKRLTRGLDGQVPDVGEGSGHTTHPRVSRPPRHSAHRPLYRTQSTPAGGAPLPLVLAASGQRRPWRRTLPVELPAKQISGPHL